MKMKRLQILVILCSILCLCSACGHFSSEKESSQEEKSNTEKQEATTEEIIEEILSSEGKQKDTDKTYRVCIDPGHQDQGNNEEEPIGPGSSETKPKVSSGTCGVESGLEEYKLNLAVALKLKELLEKNDYEVIMTRTSNEVNISNSERAKIANDAKADAFIRIHANGDDEDSSKTGAMTICQTENNEYNGQSYAKSRKLSECILDAYVEETGCIREKVWETDTMTGINWCQVPVTILEMGYMSNKEEDMLLSSEEYQEKIVNGIYKGLENYFLSEDTEEVTAKDTSSYVRLMPNVTPDMLSAEYWIRKLEEPDRVMMNAEEIAQYNDDIIYEKAYKKKFLAYSQETGSRSISKDKLMELLGEAEKMSPAYYKDGSVVSEKDWEEIISNTNQESVKNDNAISYGFAVQRASLRQYPTDAVITEDDPFTFYDEMQNSALLVGEPLVVLLESRDGKWDYILSESCSGWIKKEDLALSKSFQQWKEDSDPEDFLVVTGDEMYLDYDPTRPELSEVKLTMGCKLPLIPWEEYEKSSEGREAFGNYVVKIPCRDANGMVEWQSAYVPVSKEVSIGYLDYTQRNVLDLAFRSLGKRYGWGGMYESRDCSLYLMEIYRCFGICLPRNSIGMYGMNTKTVFVEDMSDQEKHEALQDIPVGSILYIKGHVMMYLGSEGENNYVISASATSIPDGSEEKTSVQSVVINDLQAKRKNGETWAHCIEKFKCIVP